MKFKQTLFSINKLHLHRAHSFSLPKEVLLLHSGLKGPGWKIQGTLESNPPKSFQIMEISLISYSLRKKLIKVINLKIYHTYRNKKCLIKIYPTGFEHEPLKMPKAFVICVIFLEITIIAILFCIRFPHGYC